MDSTVAIVAIVISGTVLALQIYDRIRGGGTTSEQRAAAAKKYTDEQVAALRKDVFLKHDETALNLGQTIQSMKNMAHAAELEALRFRAWCAENYLRNGAVVELKNDVDKAFEKIDTRLERMEDLMMKTRAER